MRLCLVALAVCGLALSPVMAEAQTSTASFTTTITAFGGRTTANYSTLPINIDECITDPITIDLQFRNLPTTQATLTVWSGSACFNMSARIGTSATCLLVAQMDIASSGGGTLSITMDDLMCMEGLDETRTLFFLPLASNTDAAEVTDYDSLAIKIDTTAPSPPTNVQGGSGETSIEVTWTSAGDDTQEFIVYYDPNDTTCSSPLLVAGAETDGGGLRGVRASTGATSANVLGAVGVGESAAVGVVTVDLAGNQSVLSNTACVVGVATTSWLDLHKAQGGKAGDTCSVTILSSTHVSTLALWSMLIALLALRVSRRVS